MAYIVGQLSSEATYYNHDWHYSLYVIGLQTAQLAHLSVEVIFP